MEKEEHWKLLDSFTSDAPIEGSVEVKQYLTPAHVNLLNRVLAIKEAHQNLFDALIDGEFFDHEVLSRAEDQLEKGLSLLAGHLVLSATYSITED